MQESRANSQPIRWLAASILLIASVVPTTAAADTDSDKWKFDADIYLWGAGIKGTTATGGDIDISFNDLLNNLDMAFMGGLGATKGKYSLFLDALYLSVSGSDSYKESIPVLGPLELEVDVDGEVGINAWIATLGGGYNIVENEKATLNLIGGARYFWLQLPVKFDFSAVPLGHQVNRQKKETPKGKVWDGIVGAKGKINLNDKWYLPYYADVGTGQSHLTWQVAAGVGYKFKYADVLLSYRYLDYEFKSDSAIDDLNLKGPLLGAKFYF